MSRKYLNHQHFHGPDVGLANELEHRIGSCPVIGRVEGQPQHEEVLHVAVFSGVHLGGGETSGLEGAGLEGEERVEHRQPIMLVGQASQRPIRRARSSSGLDVALLEQEIRPVPPKVQQQDAFAIGGQPRPVL